MNFTLSEYIVFHNFPVWVYGIWYQSQTRTHRFVGDHDEVVSNCTSGKFRAVTLLSGLTQAAAMFLVVTSIFLSPFYSTSLDSIYCCSVPSGFRSYWSFSDLKFNYRLVIATTFSSCPAPVGLIMQSDEKLISSSAV